MSTLTSIVLIISIIWFWLDSARAREIATELAAVVCRQRGLQFLDQTVALRAITPRWTGKGIRIKRLFRFEYSEEGLGRHQGHIIMVGIDLEELSLGLPSDPARSNSSN
ncbi:MAG: DUF3301 domain-containing protein [Halobacteria archaeon]|nr:DUF3301 domain-containing protein [Halobacteria archaeon]